jgi:hypothetical protein
MRIIYIPKIPGKLFSSPDAMKTSLSSLAILMFLSVCPLKLPASEAALELWVTPEVPDASDRSSNNSSNPPLTSLQSALEHWRGQSAVTNASAGRGLRIILHGGVYPLTMPLGLSAPNAANVPVCIEAAPGEYPILSGGVGIGHWKKLAGAIPGLPEVAQGKIWVAEAPETGGRTLEFRQLWVNGQKAVRAREPNDGTLARLVAWDKSNQEATIPAAALAGIRRPAGLEMVIDQVWEIAILRVESIRYPPSKPSDAVLRFKQPESRIEFQHPWPPVTVNAKYQAPFFLANAIEFLDAPGEWFEDVAAGKIYYWPRPGEDLTRAEVFAPALETLVQIEGTPDAPITSVQFKGITFSHTTWLRPSQQGHVPLQAGMYLLDARKLSPKGTPYHPGLDNLDWVVRPPAAVSVKNAGQIAFIDCTFEHLAAVGLDFASGTHDDLVQGCLFRDLGGNGIQLGKFSDTNVETHLPYQPSNPLEICARETIANNVLSDCGNEDWGCVGIGVGYARKVMIAHNELFNLPYSGISVGWGWTKMTNASRDNLIIANRIHEVGQRLGDLGGIYLLSAQPGTVVAENVLWDLQPSPFVPDPQHWFYLYLDEGSSFITVRDNWCPSEKFLKNANGPGNVWTNNGPQVSEAIKTAAGLEPAFKHEQR